MIGAGISLTYVQGLAESLKAGQTGYGIVVARDGTFISHPNKEYVMRKKVTDFDDPSAASVGKIMISGGSGMYRYSFEGQKKIAFYQSIPITGWFVATIVPEDELFAPAIRMIRTLFVITLMILILAGGAIFIASHHLTRPLYDLAAHAQTIANGNLAVKALDVASDDEVGKLAASFNDMMTKLLKRDTDLREARNGLEIQVKQRTQELMVLNEELKQLSLSDGLTGIANRRYFDIFIEQEWRRAKRQNKAIALIILDIDCFKTYNDTYGHQAGDECLKRIASVLKTTTKRATDLSARYGGEEFAIVLPDIDEQCAYEFGEALRSDVEKLGINHRLSTISEHVTISVGVAVFEPAQEKDAPSALIAAADQAMYQAKQEGRNRTRMAETRI